MEHKIGRLVLLALIYLIPILFLLSSLKRVYGNGKKPEAEELSAPPPEPASIEGDRAAPEPGPVRGIRGKYSKAVFVGPLVIFLTFILVRIFAPKYIFSRGLQGAVFQNVWIYVFIITLPLCLFGLGYGLWALNGNRGKGWPIFLIFGSLATLFIVSVFAVILLTV